jgi:hypothetical protein
MKFSVKLAAQVVWLDVAAVAHDLCCYSYTAAVTELKLEIELQS